MLLSKLDSSRKKKRKNRYNKEEGAEKREDAKGQLPSHSHSNHKE